MHHELSSEDRGKLEILSESELTPPVISVAELEALCEGDEGLEELLQEVLDICVQYAETVAEFKKQYTQSNGVITETVESANTIRSSCHTTAISTINSFSRMLARKGKDNQWMVEGGMDGKNRAAYWKFAITLTLSRL